jgi:hypothetical protein
MRASYGSRTPEADDERPLSLRVRLLEDDPLDKALLARLGPLKPNAIHMASAILANFRIDPQATVFYSRDSTHYAEAARKRYFPAYYTYRATKAAVDALARGGLVEDLRTLPSPRATKRSRLRATALLAKLIADAPAWTPQSIVTELIVLRSSGKSKQELDYVDTDHIRAMRAEVEAHNAYQATFTVDLDGADASFASLLALCCRLYHRVFSGDFDHGGRWYALWQNIKKELRPHIRIDGRPTIELDFHCCHPRLFLASAGLEALFDDPEFDFYRLPPFERADVKLAVNALLNAPSSRSALGALAKDLRERRRPDASALAKRLCRAIPAAWPTLAACWGTGVGIRLQRIDADICTEVQAEMRRRAIPVLSLHDSFIVPAEHKSDLQQVMDAAMARACRHVSQQPIKSPARAKT